MKVQLHLINYENHYYMSVGIREGVVRISKDYPGSNFIKSHIKQGNKITFKPKIHTI